MSGPSWQVQPRTSAYFQSNPSNEALDVFIRPDGQTDGGSRALRFRSTDLTWFGG